MGVLWIVSCTDWTFDMLPKDAGAPLDVAAGGDMAAGAAPGTGGASGKGGAPPDMSQAGAGDSPGMPCSFDGCCTRDADCTSSDMPYCALSQRKCVGCRFGNDCPDDRAGGCGDLDCSDGNRCDYATLTCKPPCSRTQPCPTTGSLQVCSNRNVCTECEPDAAPGSSGCESDLKCSVFGNCVECLGSYDCTDSSKPYCGPNSKCRPCQNDYECNPDGSGSTAPPRVCDKGTCEPTTPPSP
jgi:hypothetical protein